MNWISATNGYGPVEKNMSVGGQGAGDGRRITLNGVPYTRGLGVHAESQVKYKLGGVCSSFLAVAGVDDESGSSGSVIFQVWADGAKLWESGVMTGAGASQNVNVSVGGRNELTLIATSAGDGLSWDHADWADARLTCSSAPPVVTTSSLGGYVSDRSWVYSTNGWGPTEKDKSNGESAPGDGRTITLNGATFAKGLGMHAPAEVRYTLNGACSSFDAVVGVDDEVGAYGSIVFQVWADGTKLYDSGVMTGSAASKNVSVLLAGRRELSLILTTASDGLNSDHGDWGNARLTCQSAIQHSVSLSWNASTTPNPTGYNVYRATASTGSYTKLNASPLPGLSYVDDSVASGQTYFYVATTVDVNNNESAYSNQAMAIVPMP